MQTPKLPANEASRIQALHSLHILDTLPEDRFDRITRLAQHIFQVPMALISLVDSDRQWFKSNQGLEAAETPRDVSFCGHALHSNDIFEVPDTLADQRFYDNPLVTGSPHIRFYAGQPLRLSSGIVLGTLCLLDTKPRQLSEADRACLVDLAAMAQQEISSAQLATVDHLTQLTNRRGFEALSHHLLASCQRFGLEVRLLFIDLDRFKEINDRLGHAEGDKALISFSNILRRTFRNSDVIARFGGDEFAVLMSQHCGETAAAALNRLSDAVAAHNSSVPSESALAYSAGLINYDPLQHGDAQALLAQADQEMYRHKQSRSQARL